MTKIDFNKPSVGDVDADQTFCSLSVAIPFKPLSFIGTLNSFIQLLRFSYVTKFWGDGCSAKS